jgi:hypothetical protein
MAPFPKLIHVVVDPNDDDNGEDPSKENLLAYKKLHQAVEDSEDPTAVAEYKLVSVSSFRKEIAEVH